MSDIALVKESVRGIIEYILKEGSLDDRYMAKNRALEGTIAHQKLQASNEKTFSDYEKEVRLEYSFKEDNMILNVEGRADGIIKEKNKVIIEEIKSTMKSLIYIDEDYNELHWAQAKFYGYIYSVQNDMEEIYIRLSYYNLDTDEVKSFDRRYSFNELKGFIEDIVNKYMKWIKLSLKIREQRNISIRSLKFPFERYRKGQRNLAVTCYNTIKNKGVLFVQAPTGIGKTISTLFPAIKALGEGLGGKIAYLTAKTITRTVAEETLNKLKKNGLVCRNITLTSKEKICFRDSVKCNPEDCIYAVDYFTKANDVIFKIISKDQTFTREVIENYAKKYNLCPFELSLDLSSWCDIVICDYNYAFDPTVKLKRFFEESADKNIVLVDEGHNLVDRARGMFSAELYKSKILSVSKMVKGKVPGLYKALNSINKQLIEIRREVQEQGVRSIYKKEEYKELYKALKSALKEGDEYLIKSHGITGFEEILELYFDIRKFITISELYAKEYVTIVECDKSEVRVKLFCVNPSKNLSKVVQNSYSTIIFSATLTPTSYYIDLLGGNEESYRMRLQSPFNKENFKVYGYQLNMRFTQRENNIDKLCGLINKFISEEKGNYMVFSPSYVYLNKMYTRYIELYGEEKTICQGEALTEEEKEKFINNFRVGANITAFCVIGGIFSEGIDLPGNKLIGSVVIGVGFPKISKEADIIKDYYGACGFDYAYVFQGINKVLQAAGRVIRTEEDRGRLLLIDDRYFTMKYRGLLPQEWEVRKYEGN